MSTQNLQSNTDVEPTFYLLDESITDIDKLTEVFMVAYREEVGTFREPKENYIFYDNFKDAFAKHKMIGSTISLLKRIFTDDEKLINLSKLSTISIPEKDVVEVEEKKEEINKDIPKQSLGQHSTNDDYESDSSHESSDEEGSIKPVKESVEKAKDILYSA